jgi:hypothetical protein
MIGPDKRYWPGAFTGVHLEHRVGLEMGEYIALNPTDSAGRGRRFKEAMLVEARQREWNLREFEGPVFDPGDVAQRLGKPASPVKLVRDGTSNWLVAAYWPFGDEFARRISQLVNSVSIYASINHAYRENWVLELNLAGHLVQTIMPEEHMDFLGVPEACKHAFRGTPSLWADICDMESGRVSRAWKRLEDPLDEENSGVKTIGEFFAELGIWGARWSEYFRVDICPPCDTLILTDWN